MQLDPERFAEIVSALVKAATDPLKERIAVLENRPPAKGEKGDPGDRGERGERGEAGVSGTPGERGSDGKPGPAGEHGHKGADGKNGLDGMGFDDYQVSFDGNRTITLALSSGWRKKEWSFRVPSMVYRGVWREGQYEAGDTATTAGSVWVALQDTTEKPGLSKHWQLCVKKGNDGRDAKPGEKGPKGDKGDPGDRGPERW